MNYKNYNDYELIYMVRENDDNSRNILYEKYYPIVCKFASDYYHRYSDYGYEYDDFYQEAMYAFDKAIVNYNEEKDTLFYTFLIVCLRRCLLSFVRNISNKNKNISNSLFVELDNDSLIDKKSTFSFIFEEKEIQDICKEIMYDDTLSLIDTSMFELRLNGFSYREIGVLLGMTASDIEFKFRKIKRRLKRKLKKYSCK